MNHAPTFSVKSRIEFTMTRAIFLFALLLVGCASNQKVAPEVFKPGVIESVTPIELDNSSGGTAGSVAGQVGGIYSGSMMGMILGSVVGGTVGSQAGISTKPGVELWVKLDEDGSSVYVMQPVDKVIFKIGDHVQLHIKNGERNIEMLSETKQ
jgi:outer membrane lipoprotein SlyB